MLRFVIRIWNQIPDSIRINWAKIGCRLHSSHISVTTFWVSIDSFRAAFVCGCVWMGQIQIKYYPTRNSCYLDFSHFMWFVCGIYRSVLLKSYSKPSQYNLQLDIFLKHWIYPNVWGSFLFFIEEKINSFKCIPRSIYYVRICRK